MICQHQYQTARASGAAPAAPPGGAQVIGGWGCGFGDWLFPPLQKVLFGGGLCLLLAAQILEAEEAALSGAFVPVTVPSGQQVLLSEVLLDDSPGALWARFRFVVPGISRQAPEGADAGVEAGADFQRSAADMDYLCDSLALDYLAQHALSPSMVVISFSDRPVEFGTPDPDATQFFEAYRPGEGRCIWEAF